MSRRRRSTPRIPFSLIKRLALVVFFLIFGTSSFFFLGGKVITVHDGDTLTVLTQKGDRKKVRLYGVDSPEARQAGGTEAENFARSLAFLEEVELTTVDKDQYGRDVAIVRLKDGRILNAEMIRAGHAWVYTRYCDRPECAVWKGYEATAKKEKRGLWKEARPIPPWRWRDNRNR
jgi:Micrococcal nuclease (thermonuclease) homologs